MKYLSSLSVPAYVNIPVQVMTGDLETWGYSSIFEGKNCHLVMRMLIND
jgi:hypothetical protein